jgi:hypothetical protein
MLLTWIKDIPKPREVDEQDVYVGLCVAFPKLTLAAQA